MNKLLPKQEHAVYYLRRPEVRSVLYGGAAGGGKSALGCAWLHEACQTYPGSRWVMGRHELKTLRETTLATFNELTARWGTSHLWKWHERGLFLEYTPNGSVILAKDLKYMPSDPNYNTLGSLEICGAFVDEANQLEARVVGLLLSRCRYKMDAYGITPKVLLTCNPDVNFVFTDYYDPWKKRKLPVSRRFVQALPTDNPHLPASYLEALDALEENDRQRLKLGNWEYSDAENWLLGGFDVVLDAFDNPAYTTGALGPEIAYITSDAARFGPDLATVAVWRGWQLVDLTVFTVSATTEIAACIKAKQAAYAVARSNTVVDADGIGSGVVDLVQCVEFHGGAAPFERIDPQGDGRRKHRERFANLKAQCGFHFAEQMKARKVNLRRQALAGLEERARRELYALRYELSPEVGAPKALIKKKDQKRLLNGLSPDLLDTFIMRAYFDVRPASPRRGVRTG